MYWDTRFDRFLDISGVFQFIMYTAPGALILFLLFYLDIGTRFWVPVLLIWGVGALCHAIGYGAQAATIQINLSTEYTVGELKKLAASNELARG
jgi:hypothetical protein